MNVHVPQILAPAGDRDAFLAALAAGADAVYVGLKHFSARMLATNFSVAELAAMREMAARRDAKLYVAMNVLVKPGEMAPAGRLVQRLAKAVRPQALIVQDLAMVELARQAGFEGEIHLSTLANISHPAALAYVFEQLGPLGVARVILPRELSIDEIKACAAACPPGLNLEVFVHGALCYAVSGRCYWSSYLGGKSGLRGRCVQPCRRRFGHRGQKGRYFSCRDLGLDVLTKTLLDIPQVTAWKIEGRKKGPHYVFHVVSAYRRLRDESTNPEAKKAAVDYLEQALGRPITRHRFLPQRIHSPISVQEDTGSGRLAGKVSREPFMQPRFPLLRGDLLRVGYEDEPWHATVRVARAVPKGGRYDFKLRVPPAPGTSVFLIDRREPELSALLGTLGAELEALGQPATPASEFEPRLPRPIAWAKDARPVQVELFRRLPTGKLEGEPGLWVAPGQPKLSKGMLAKVWWWLPPVIWPDDEATWTSLVCGLVAAGGRRLVLGAPWQAGLLPPELRAKTKLWAGPFCNITNAMAVATLQHMGFVGAFASPELPRDDLLELSRTSPLPIAMVESGLWPLCVSRTLAEEVKPGEPFFSPKGEAAFAWRHGPDVWIYPGWPVDLSAHHQELAAAGIVAFVRLHETKPPQLQKLEGRRASGTFNYDLSLT